MIGVRPAGGGIDHGFRVAMVRGDDPGAAARLQSLKNCGESGVHGFDGFDGGWQISGMPHHVGIGVIHDDGVESAFFNGVHDGIRNSLGGHFGFQIVGRDFRRGHQNALFTEKRLFDTAIEKISYVRIFFGFRSAQIRVMQISEDLRKDLFEFVGLDDGLQPRPVFVVLGHGNVK